MKKRKRIEEQLDMIEKHLANAEAYAARGVNVEGSPFLHLDDWRGQSGHPSWMRNVMIPATIKRREKKEKALERIEDKAKARNLARLRRAPKREC